MIEEALQETASLYALDLLEPDEAGQFERALSGNPELQQLVAELRNGAATLAYGAPDRLPPPHLKAEITRAIHLPQNVTAFPRLKAIIPWAVAACLAIACVLLGSDRARLVQELERLRHRDELSRTEIATLTSKLSDAPRAEAVVIWDPEKQQGILKTSYVPPSGKDHDYQLWVVDPQYKNPVNAGVFKVGKDGKARISFKPDDSIKSAKGFAISLERKGGVDKKAEGPIVLITQ